MRAITRKPLDRRCCNWVTGLGAECFSSRVSQTLLSKHNIRFVHQTIRKLKFYFVVYLCCNEARSKNITKVVTLNIHCTLCYYFLSQFLIKLFKFTLLFLLVLKLRLRFYGHFSYFCVRLNPNPSIISIFFFYNIQMARALTILFVVITISTRLLSPFVTKAHAIASVFTDTEEFPFFFLIFY